MPNLHSLVSITADFFAFLSSQETISRCTKFFKRKGLPLMDYWLCPFNESVGFHWLLELNSALTSPLYYISHSSFLLTHWRKNTDMSATKKGKYFKIHPGLMVFKKGSGNRLVQFNSWNKHQVIWVVRLLSIKAFYGQGLIAWIFSVSLLYSLTCWRWTVWRGNWWTCLCCKTLPLISLTLWTSQRMLWPVNTGYTASKRP